MEFGEIGEGPVPRDRNDWPGKEKPLMFGTLFSDCYTGVLVFEKGGVFGAIDPYYMDDNGDLVVRWWYNADVSKSFDYAPVKFVVSKPLLGSLVNNSQGSFLGAWEVVVDGGKSYRDFGGIHLLRDILYLVIYAEGDDDLLGFSEWMGDFNSLVGLDLSGRGIKSLDALEFMPYIEVLNLHAGDITNLDPVKHLPKIEYLNVSRNEITDISALLEIDSLREVHLGENPLGDDAIDLHIPQLLSKGVEVHLD